MAPAVVYLHIGSPKTGTTYIQNTLWANRAMLKDDGVLLPGQSRFARVQAASDMMKWHPDDGGLPQSWRRLSGQVTRWSGRSAVISQEFLYRANSEQIHAMVDSLGGGRVEVVLTTRDVARLVPAQWQTSVRQRSTWTLGEYADAVAGTDTDENAEGAARHFWRRQDYGVILRRFVDALSLEQVRVVTVPPSGGDPDELWRRFCQACGLDPTTTKPGGVSHESLGAESAEIMRRVNGRPPVDEMPMRVYKKSVNGALSRRSLAGRRSLETGLVLPERHRDWAEHEASRLIDDIEAVGVEVIGDLDDLRPRPTSKAYVDPDQISDSALLDAALDGLAGMAAEHARLIEKLNENPDEPAEAPSTERQANNPKKGATPSRLRRGLGRLKSQLKRVLRRLTPRG